MRLDISSESSARQRIHMKNQAYFLSKIKVKNQNDVCCNFLFGALRVNDSFKSLGNIKKK